MRNDNLKSITFYVTADELEDKRSLAKEYGVSLSAVIRSKLGLPRLEPYKQKGSVRASDSKKSAKQ